MDAKCEDAEEAPVHFAPDGKQVPVGGRARIGKATQPVAGGSSASILWPTLRKETRYGTIK